MRFPLSMRILHWLMAVIVIVMLLIGFGMVSSISNYHWLLSLHRPLGILVLLLVIARIINRLCSKVPPLPASIDPEEKLIAHASEAFFYFLLFALPLVGWAMLSAGSYPIVMFGAFHLPPILPANPTLFAMLRNTHTVLAYALLGTFIAHMGAMLMHTLVLRDGLLDRMSVWSKDQKH